MNTNQKPCLERGGRTLYHNTVNSAGGYGPAFLPGLRGFLSFAKFEVVVCGDCGLTRFYAESRALGKLSQARTWRRV